MLPAMATTVVFETDLGAFEIALDEERAPKTVANFLRYVDEGHYSGTIFHRVIPGFMAQGGGYDASYEKKSVHEPVENEADKTAKNTRGTVAMARTNDPNSATAQFFINVADNAFLDHTAPTDRGWGYAVFGKITGGIDVVDRIKGVKTGRSGGHQDVPVEDVVIEKAEVV